MVPPDSAQEDPILVAWRRRREEAAKQDAQEKVQEGKEHTDTINRPFPGKYWKLWEVGGKT
eukprot:3615734-Pyramimonas_sp.AAC.1